MENQEIKILAQAINTSLAAVEVSGLGKVISKADETDLSNDPRNIIVNQVAYGVFNMILSEKLKGMYARVKEQAKA